MPGFLLRQVHDSGLDASDVAQIVAAGATVLAVGAAVWSAWLSRAPV